MKPLPLCLLLTLSFPAHAEIYKCKDANGRVQFSDAPCSGKTAPARKPAQTKKPGGDPAADSPAWESAEAFIRQGMASSYVDERRTLFRSASRYVCMAIREGMSEAQYDRAMALQQELQVKAQYSQYADSGAQDSYMAVTLMGVASGTCHY